MTQILRDAGFGLRLLRRNPGSTLVAVLTLALGIGATTAMFSVIYATWLAPLPYRDAERLVMVWSHFEGRRESVSQADFIDWKRRATVFEDLNAWNGRDVNLSVDGRPERIKAGPATSGFLAMLGYGYPLALGRSFVEEEGTPGRDHAVVLTHRLWQQRFGGDPAIVGKAIRIDQEPYTVVGVLGKGPADENMNRLWLPQALDAEQNRSWRWMLVMGRLKPGVTLDQANQEMAVVAQGLAEAYPATNAKWTISVEPFRNNFVTSETKTALWLLLGAVGFVLLIACANVANLLLARGTARRRELAVRSSLGATRGVVVRQFITESLVLSLVGGALGVALAYGLVDAILALLPPFTLPTEVDVRLNVPVLLFTLAACTISGILFGCAPAWQAARSDANATLKGGGGRELGGGHERLRRALVVLEFALALSLLCGGGLALQSFVKLVRTDLGLRAERVLTFSLPMPEGRIDSPEQANAFYRALVERVKALPGVSLASVSTGIPLRWMGGTTVAVAGEPVEADKRPRVAFNRVTPEYFETLGIRIVRGRAFTDQDRAGSEPVAIVNEAFLARVLHGADPLARRIVVDEIVPGRQGPVGVERQIVGVYADVRTGGPQNPVLPQVEVPFWQSPRAASAVAVRTSVDPATLQSSLAAVIASLDPDLPMGNTETLEQVVRQRLAADRFNVALFSSFAAVALVLAAVGIYGVMAFAVAQRAKEIGLRMALGARRSDVVGQVVREGMTTAVGGALLGSVGAYVVAQAMRGVLPRLGEPNATAFVLIAVTLLGAALVACLVPAWRAASIDPMVALRQE